MASLRPRTVVLGFDGIDARMTQVLMQQGHLPNLKAMAELGGFHRVLSTTPAESAVAWASFAMGANPGATGVFDFIERQPGSYAPRLAGSEVVTEATPMGRRWGGVGAGAVAGGAAGHLATRRVTRRQWIKGCALAMGAGLGLVGTGVPLLRWLPRRVERVHSTVGGRAWWDRLSEQGQRCTVLRMPMTYPAQAEDKVELLAGLGVPDLRGTQGTYCVITDGPGERCGKGEVCRVTWKQDQCEAHLEVGATLELKRLGGDAVRIIAAGESQILRRGEWSGWLPLKLPASPIVTRRGMVRVHFCQDPAGLRLYVTPVELDPTWLAEENPISSPAGFAREVCQGVGRYHTLGWETQTWGLTDGVLDERAYLADVWAAMEWNENQLEWGLKRAEWDELMLVVQATDQVQHLFFDEVAVAMRAGGKVDERHPLAEVYRRMDQIVGRVLREKWRVVVMSDHGFAPYRRAVNLNTWLAKRGWLALKDSSKWDETEPWGNVDWFNTRAYALGLSGIYLNVAGREPGGIVKREGEYEHLQDKLREMLLGWRDAKTGRKVCTQVYRNGEIYAGRYCDRGPDLVVGLGEGWRVSSASAVGGMPAEEIEDNGGHWQGDHCGVEAGSIPGVCMASFKNDWPGEVGIGELAGRIWGLGKPEVRNPNVESMTKSE